ncbi:MAG: hypothetical protein HAW62_03390 [Endozoicomonadaceae bacterium]|nr:hypothetical protein [Endozoicomonadaceae bacterium]
MEIIINRTDYDEGFIIGYDPTIPLKCMIFEIKNIKLINNSSGLKYSNPNPWESIKKCIFLNWEKRYALNNQAVAFVSFRNVPQCVVQEIPRYIDVKCFSFNPNIFNLMLLGGHCGLKIKTKSELTEIPWDFQYFGIKNLQELKKSLQSKNELYMAIYHGQKTAVHVFFNQLKTYCESTLLSDDEKMALIDILFSKNPLNGYSGLLKACQNQYHQIVDHFFNVIQSFIIDYPECKHDFLSILFYCHVQGGSSLNLTLLAHFEVDILKNVGELLTWPERLALQAGNPYVTAWFEANFNPAVLLVQELFNGEMMHHLYQFQITWILSGIPTLSKLNDYFSIHHTLSFALQHGYIKSVILLLTFISTYIDETSSLSTDELDALENILFAKCDNIPGIMLACKNGHMCIVLKVFLFLTKVLKEQSRKILFYTHHGEDTILKICVETNQTETLKIILTWPEVFDHDFEENMMIHDWFYCLNSDNQTVLQYAINNDHYEAISLLQTFQNKLGKDIRGSTSSTRKRLLSEDSTLQPTKKRCLPNNEVISADLEDERIPTFSSCSIQ